MTRRLGRSATIGELLTRNGEAMIGNAEVLTCPHCGAPPRESVQVTPVNGYTLRFLIPPFGCCAQNKRGARS